MSREGNDFKSLEEDTKQMEFRLSQLRDLVKRTTSDAPPKPSVVLNELSREGKASTKGQEKSNSKNEGDIKYHMFKYIDYLILLGSKL